MLKPLSVYNFESNQTSKAKNKKQHHQRNTPDGAAQLKDSKEIRKHIMQQCQTSQVG